MKKLFVAVLAIAGLVACNNEPETIFNSSMKSVSLTIANSNEVTRAITDASAGADFECAAAADLTVLFADRAGKVIETRALTPENKAQDGTYTFHKLPETVQQVGVIALRGNATPATLAAAEAIWKTETIDAQVANIVVYGASGQMDQDGVCTVDGVNYPLFKGEVTVAPYHTRFEVLSFQCTDLGTNEYGYSKITLNKMTYGGQYEQALGKELLDPTTVATAGEGKAWSWNWAPEKAAANLVVDLTVEGKGYTVAIPNKTLTINGYQDKDGKDITTFACENVYKLKVPFLEANIDATDAYICVNVEVEIAKWVVNTITPTFGTNPTPAQ